ncbi:MAG: primosomal protein N' [Gammaproteobacteria bacterium]|nr:primosomal protein N' [Gammaproteobacteria bacterium]NND59907.1 primosomal protein N' [Gammaproteobacteria bacterium]
MKATPQVVRVALPTPVRQLFEYLPPAAELISPGVRVRVPFGRKRQVGIVTHCGVAATIDPGRLRPVVEVLDTEPVVDAALLRLLLWASDYYCCPPGEVITTALPTALRNGQPATAVEPHFFLTASAADTDLDSLRTRAPRQAQALRLLQSQVQGVAESALRAQMGDGWRSVLRRLQHKDWVSAEPRPVATTLVRGSGAPPTFEPTDDQVHAIGKVTDSAEFAPFLLYGITGSGKTEVYLQLISRCIARRQQSLVLVPEIGLTPQLLERFRRRLDGAIVSLHSGLNDSERLAAWRAAQDGTADVIVGTRSAIFAPLPRPGLLIVDEEHDASYKQQDGWRYSARDFAVMRARELDVPIVLGSATPSLESLHNVQRGRYTQLRLSQRPGAAVLPTMRLVDCRMETLEGGLSATLRAAIARHLDGDGQVLLFLNRRGFAPAWFCIDCSWIASCTRCDARLTYHQRENRLRCHHCGASCPPPTECPQCSHPLQPVGLGTERIAETLTRLYGDFGIARIDRDNTRRKGELERVLGEIRAGRHRLLVGTQMLTKGHHFPDVTLVGIVDADPGLFATDPRSSERLAQLLVQVAGRAGRAQRPGEVLIQTQCPQHPLLNTLTTHGYDDFATVALAEREAANWPPYCALALLRARAADQQHVDTFLQATTRLLRLPAGIELLGPAAAPMARRAGQYRAQVLLQGERRALHSYLRPWVDAVAALPESRRVHWSVDVDPVDLY